VHRATALRDAEDDSRRVLFFMSGVTPAILADGL
jgi:hypothetical protein